MIATDLWGGPLTYRGSMKYSITLTGTMNIRNSPSTIDNSNVIRALFSGQVVRGNNLDSTGRFLSISTIDDIPITNPTWIATTTTSGKLIAQSGSGVLYAKDVEIIVTDVNGKELFRTSTFGTYEVRING